MRLDEKEKKRNETGRIMGRRETAANGTIYICTGAGLHPVQMRSHLYRVSHPVQMLTLICTEPGTNEGYKQVPKTVFPVEN
jgi:hypothetical protein